MVEQIAVALGQSFAELEKTSNKKFDGTSKDLKTYLESEVETMKSQHYEALAGLSLRLSTIRDGKDANEQAIIDAVLAKIPPTVIPEVVPETPNETVHKINQSNIQIKKERIEGLTDALMNIAYAAMSSMPVTTSFFNGLRGKNLTLDGATAYQVGDTVHIQIGTGTGTVKTIVAGPGISVDSTDPQNPIVSATGGGGGITAWLTPAESPNGVITAFTVVGTPTDVVADGVNFYLNNGFTIVAGQVVFDNPPTQYVRYRTAGTWSTPAESPNGVILTFTVASSAPTDVIADGLEFFNGFGYTFAAGQITFDNPPTSYVRYR